MTDRKGLRGKLSLLTAGAALAMFAAAPYASATTVRINFHGSAGNGYANLTLASDPNASSNYSPNLPSSTPTLSQWDPEGAQYITGASGSFGGTAITGLVATNSGTPPPLPTGGYENLPNSFSWFTSSAGQNSYDNLFYYPDGSPLVCPPVGSHPYTFHGGLFDIFGAMFTLHNGDVVGLWSDGVTAPGAFGPNWPGGLTYGIDVYTPVAGGGYDQASSQFAGAFASVPEPRFMWLLGAALLGLFGWRRTVEIRRRPQRIE